MVVVIGRFHFPDAFTRAFTRSAVTFCSGVCGKIAERWAVRDDLGTLRLLGAFRESR